MSNAEVSAEYCQHAFVARHLAMSASCPDTKAYLLENNFGFPKLAGTSPRTVVRG
jgi:hypothetical protein